MNKKPSYYPWIVWGIAVTFFFFIYIIRTSPSIMELELITDLKINVVDFGLLAAFFYFPYSIMQIPVGVIIDRIGAYKIMVIMTMISGVSCLLFASSTSLYPILLSRVFLGVAASFGFVGAIRLAASWFSAERMGTIVGMTQSIGMLGAIFTFPLAVILQYIDWRTAYAGFTVMLIILGVLIYKFAYPNPEREFQPDKSSVIKSLFVVLKSPYSWLNGIFVGIFFNFTTVFGENLGVAFFQNVYGFSVAKATLFKNLVFVGWLIGGPTLGVVSDMLKRRKLVMIPAYVLMAVCYLAIIYIPNIPSALLAAILIIAGIGSSGAAICYTYATEIMPKNVAATALAFSNMASILVGTIFTQIIYSSLGQLTVLGLEQNLSYFQQGYLPLTFSILMGILFGLVLKEKKNA